MLKSCPILSREVLEVMKGVLEGKLQGLREQTGANIRSSCDVVGKMGHAFEAPMIAHRHGHWGDSRPLR